MTWQRRSCSNRLLDSHEKPCDTGKAYSVQGLGFSVSGSGFRIQGSGFRV